MLVEITSASEPENSNSPTSSAFPVSSPKTEQSAGHKGFLVVSPYTGLSHLLELSRVSISCRLLATALTRLEPVGDNYATIPYVDGFNWSTVLTALQSSVENVREFNWEEQSFYIVVFRSQLRPDIDRSHLGQLDQAAHAEAMASGGFLKYWFGHPDANRRNLATCMFRPIL